MRVLRSLALGLLCIVCVSSGESQVARPCRPPSAVPDPAVPLNQPDRYVWQLFVQVNAKGSQTTFRADGGRTLTTNNALWETWADDPETFPASPDPSNPPQWPAAARHKRLLEKAKGGAHPHDAAGVRDGLLTFGVTGDEEVRRNRPAFDYVVRNGLWYTEGIAAFFAGGNIVDFPVDSIEVKANWIPITDAEKPRYHWNYDSKGQLYGMVAMHVTSKAIPNWIWATFEWAENPGRCDFIGCRDCFGYAPAVTASNTKDVGAIYPGGVMSKELESLFQQGGLTGEWGAEWRNYRLKGSQTDFTDPTGVPLLVGNSVTEAGFVQTASCMTCHARAAVDATGHSSFPIFGEKEPLPLQTGSPQQFQDEFTTYNGSPDPSWFWTFTGQGTRKTNMQTDFVWAIPMRAKSSKK